MKKILLFLALLITVTLVASLTACVTIDSDIHVNPPPETSAYTPTPLNIEFFDESAYANMSPFQKYPTQNTVADSTAQTPVSEDESPESTELSAKEEETPTP